jgi:hypothetical protein
MAAQRGSTGNLKLYVFFNLGPRYGLFGQLDAPAAVLPGMSRCPNVQEAGWTPGPVCTGSDNVSPTGSIP